MGGVDQLLELVETGVGLREEKTRDYPVAIYYGEEDAPEVTRCCKMPVALAKPTLSVAWQDRVVRQRIRS